MIEGSGSVKIVTGPNPGGPKLADPEHLFPKKMFECYFSKPENLSVKLPMFVFCADKRDSHNGDQSRPEVLNPGPGGQ